MKFTKNNNNSNINTYPEVTFDPLMTQITLADFNTNALLLLHFLIHKGFVRMSADYYYQFVTLYTNKELQIVSEKSNSSVSWSWAPAINKPNKRLLGNVVHEFNRLVTTIKVIDKTRLIRFLGGELMGKGVNDYFVLKLLYALHIQGAKYEILLSNHGITFIEAIENFKEYNNELVINPRLNRIEEIHSTNALRTCIEFGLLQAKDILNLYQNAYKNKLKLISYSVDIETNEIQIFSHAGINLNHIKALADLFKVEYLTSSMMDFVKTINAIDDVFVSHVETNNIHRLYTEKTMKQDYKYYLLREHKWAVADLVWGRSCYSPPLEKLAFALSFVHGLEHKEKTQHDEDQYIFYASDGQQKRIEKNEKASSARILKKELELSPAKNSSLFKYPKENSPNNDSSASFFIFDMEMDDIKPDTDNTLSKFSSNVGPNYA